MTNNFESKNGRYFITYEVDGTANTYEVMSFEQYLCAKTDEPFALCPGGRLFYQPFRTYVDEYGNSELMSGEMSIFVLQST